MGSYPKVYMTHGLKPPSEDLFKLYEDELVYHYDISREIARHLIHSYGTMSLRVVQLGQQLKLNERIHMDYPFLKSELAYAIRHEMCEKPNDVVCRRVPIAVVNKKVAEKVLPEVVEMMAKERKWTGDRKKQELEEALRDLNYYK